MSDDSYATTAMPRAPSPLPHPTSDDKRCAARADLEVDVSLYSETQFFAGLTEDVSEGGVFIATYETLPQGTEIQLAFTLPNGHAVRTVGVVRWLRGVGASTGPGMGVQFQSLHQTDLAAIVSFVRHRPPLLWEDPSEL